MATEKAIHGKRDRSKHEGKRSELRRLDEALNQIAEFETIPEDLQERSQPVEYYKLFEEKSASRNVIRDESPYMLFAVNKMIEIGNVTGQRTLGIDMEPDVIYTLVRRKFDNS